MKHNNVIPNQHFKKKWQFRVRTWFNQPARKLRRRQARQDKAAKAFPRPAAGALRPVVHGQTVKYNAKLRLGRGFSLAELKEAGIHASLARTIGIAVDHRRRNKSLEGLQANVARLKAYRSNLVIFPRNAKKPNKLEATKEEAAAAAQQAKGVVMPIAKEAAALEKVAITQDMKAFKAYTKLRVERMNQRMVGIRAKRSKEAEAQEKDA